MHKLPCEYGMDVWSVDCVHWKSFSILLRVGMKENKHILNIANAKIPSVCLPALPEPEKLKFVCIHEY